MTESDYTTPQSNASHATDGARVRPLVRRLEILYNGDYPGYACARFVESKVPGGWLTDEEERGLCALFGGSLCTLLDKMNAPKLPGSLEHMPMVMELALSPNDQAHE